MQGKQQSFICINKKKMLRKQKLVKANFRYYFLGHRRSVDFDLLSDALETLLA